MGIAWIRWKPSGKSKRGKAHARRFDELETLCGRTTAHKDELEYVLDGVNHCHECTRKAAQ